MFNLRLITNICNRYKLAFLRARAKNAANEATTAAEFFLFSTVFQFGQPVYLIHNSQMKILELFRIIQLNFRPFLIFRRDKVNEESKSA